LSQNEKKSIRTPVELEDPEQRYRIISLKVDTKPATSVKINSAARKAVPAVGAPGGGVEKMAPLLGPNQSRIYEEK
jgi:hypothetical protein